MEPTDQTAAGQRALQVLRAWNAGDEDNLPIALREAERICERDGDADKLLAGLITVAGFMLVNLEQRGQPAAATLAMVEAFLKASGEGGASG
jgi:hypothetical protein